MKLPSVLARWIRCFRCRAPLPEATTSSSPVRLMKVAIKPLLIELWAQDGSVRQSGHIVGPLLDYIETISPIEPRAGLLIQPANTRYAYMQHSETTVIYVEVPQTPLEGDVNAGNDRQTR